MKHATLTVCESPAFGIAWAVDSDGNRFLINDGTAGVLVEELERNDVLSCRINERNYVVKVWWPIGKEKS